MQSCFVPEAFQETYPETYRRACPRPPVKCKLSLGTLAEVEASYHCRGWVTEVKPAAQSTVVQPQANGMNEGMRVFAQLMSCMMSQLRQPENVLQSLLTAAPSSRRMTTPPLCLGDEGSPRAQLLDAIGSNGSAGGQPQEALVAEEAEHEPGCAVSSAGAAAAGVSVVLQRQSSAASMSAALQRQSSAEGVSAARQRQSSVERASAASQEQPSAEVMRDTDDTAADHLEKMLERLDARTEKKKHEKKLEKKGEKEEKRDETPMGRKKPFPRNMGGHLATGANNGRSPRRSKGGPRWRRRASRGVRRRRRQPAGSSTSKSAPRKPARASGAGCRMGRASASSTVKGALQRHIYMYIYIYMCVCVFVHM